MTQESVNYSDAPKNLSRANKYVQSVSLNGKLLVGCGLKHADVVAGGELVFEMTDRR